MTPGVGPCHRSRLVSSAFVEGAARRGMPKAGLGLGGVTQFYPGQYGADTGTPGVRGAEPAAGPQSAGRQRSSVGVAHVL